LSTHTLHFIFKAHKPKMLGLSFVAGAALLAQGVFGEGVHFLNCRSFGDASIPTRTYVSIVAV
jgi:hypothetical protein